MEIVYVYFYLINGEIIYVGKSKSPYRRFQNHVYYDAKFEKVDEVFVKEMSQSEADYFEKYYIYILTKNGSKLWNDKHKLSSYTDIGIPHQFDKYDMQGFREKFEKLNNYSRKGTVKILDNEYTSESEFIRKFFPNKSTRIVQRRRRQLTVIEGLSLDESYSKLLREGIETKDERNTRIDNYIITHAGKDRKELAADLGVSVDTIYEHIKKLVDAKQIKPKKEILKERSLSAC